MNRIWEFITEDQVFLALLLSMVVLVGFYVVYAIVN